MPLILSYCKWGEMAWRRLTKGRQQTYVLEDDFPRDSRGRWEQGNHGNATSSHGRSGSAELPLRSHPIKKFPGSLLIDPLAWAALSLF